MGNKAGRPPKKDQLVRMECPADYMDAQDEHGTDGAIARATGTTRQNISYHRKKLGLSGVVKKMRDEKTQKILDAIFSGEPINDIADRFNMTRRAIRYVRERSALKFGFPYEKKKAPVRRDNEGKPIVS